MTIKERNMDHRSRFLNHQKEAAAFASALEEVNGLPGWLIASYVNQCSPEEFGTSRLAVAVDAYVSAFFTLDEAADEEKETAAEFAWIAELFPGEDDAEPTNEGAYQNDTESKETSLYYLAAEIKKREIGRFAEKASRKLMEKARDSIEFLAVRFSQPAEIRLNQTFYADIDDVIDAWNTSHPEETKIRKPQRGEI